MLLLHKFCQPLLIFILKISLLVVLFPIVIVFIGPIYIFRIFLMISCKWLRPDLVCMLPIRDTFYAIDSITTDPKSSTVTTLVLKGYISRDQMVKRMEKVVNIKVENDSDKLLYPELRQYLVKWMGFIFWKKVQNFQVEDYVELINENEIKTNDLNHNSSVHSEHIKEIETSIVKEPYPEGQGLWGVKVLNNYFIDGEEHSVVFLKFHHSFMDGFSQLNISYFIFDEQKKSDIKVSTSNKYRVPIIEKLFLNIVVAIMTPYALLTEMFLPHDMNPWWLSREKITNQIVSAASPIISLQKLKDIAFHFGVSLNAVIISAISGAIRNKMEEEKRLQENATFTCLCPFPVPNHPKTLCNHLSDCYINFPIGISDPIQRMRTVEMELQALKTDTVTLTNFAIQPILGGLFHWLLRPIIQSTLSKATGVISLFPGRTQQGSCCGLPITSAYFSAGHDDPGIGIQFLGASYNGGWKLKIQADRGTLSSDSEVEVLMAHFVKEIKCALNLSFE